MRGSNITFKSMIIGFAALCCGLILPATSVQAQVFVDEFWDGAISGNRGDFGLNDGMVQFSCVAGRGQLNVEVSASGSPRQTTITLRNGGNYYTTSATRQSSGNYGFTVPRRNWNGFFRLLKRFHTLDIDVEAAGILQVQLGGPSNTHTPDFMQEFCSTGSQSGGGSSGNTGNGGNSGNSGNGGNGGNGGLSGISGVVPVPCALELVTRSQDGRTVNLNIVNNSNATRVIYWLDYSGERQRYAELPPGGSYSQQTAATHPWLAADSNGRCRALGIAQSNGDFSITN